MVLSQLMSVGRGVKSRQGWRNHLAEAGGRKFLLRHRDSGVTRGARWADRVSSSRHVPHVSIDGDTCHRSAVRKYHWPWFKYSNKIITSSSSVSLSIISDGSFVHFLVSVALMIKKYLKSFWLCQDNSSLSSCWSKGGGDIIFLITLSSVYLWSMSVSASLSLAVYSVSSAGAKFRSLELHNLSKVTNSIHNYIHRVYHHPTKPHIQQMSVCWESEQTALRQCLCLINVCHLRSLHMSRTYFWVFKEF